MATVTENILDNVEATLKGMTVAGGYNQPIYQVSRYTTPSQIKFSKYPAADIVIDRIDKSDEEDHGWQVCDMMIIIGAYVNHRTGRDCAHAITTLAEDIEKLLAQDVTRGGYALDSAVVAIDFDFIDPDVSEWTGVATIDYEIKYEHRRDDPSTKN